MMPPLVLLSSIEHQCVSFVWPDDLDIFVGYRFIEQSPKITSYSLPHPLIPTTQYPPPGNLPLQRAVNWLPNWTAEYSQPDDPLQLSFQAYSDGSAEIHVVENAGLQERTWRFAAEDHGVRIWMKMTTHEPLPGGYILQQCLRLTSGIGFGFRRTVARVPFLSELYLQALGNANGTLTWARIGDQWRAFPVPFTRYHTPAGAGIYQDSQGQVDCGLIVRESAPRDMAPDAYWRSVAPDAHWETWSAGLYWDRTAHISNRHPADCLHAGVDFGPLEADQSRTLHGKFYWLEGTKDDLLALWQKEFEG